MESGGYIITECCVILVSFKQYNLDDVKQRGSNENNFGACAKFCVNWQLLVLKNSTSFSKNNN